MTVRHPAKRGDISAGASLVEDLSPQLGADLDLNSFDITGTGDINIAGSISAIAGNFDIGSATDTKVIIGATSTYGGSGANGNLDIYGESGGVLYGARLIVGSSNKLSIVGLTENGATAINTIQFNAHISQQAGKQFTMLPASGSQSAVFKHLGAQFQLSMPNTTDWRISGLSGSVHLRYGIGLKIADGDDTDYITQSHAGAGGDYNFVGVNTTDINMTSGITAVNLPDLTVAGVAVFTGAPLKGTLGIPYHVSADYVGGKITVSSSEPGSPAKGDIWFDTT